MSFIEKVRQKLPNVDVYQEFVKCLDIFDKEIITRSELHSLVWNIYLWLKNFTTFVLLNILAHKNCVIVINHGRNSQPCKCMATMNEFGSTFSLLHHWVDISFNLCIDVAIFTTWEQWLLFLSVSPQVYSTTL